VAVLADSDRSRGATPHASFGGTYLIAVVGAAVYFIQQADGFWQVILALLKALVWPGFVVYGLLDLLNL
jgi:hypothetical protein